MKANLYEAIEAFNTPEEALWNLLRDPTTSLRIVSVHQHTRHQGLRNLVKEVSLWSMSQVKHLLPEKITFQSLKQCYKGHYRHL